MLAIARFISGASRATASLELLRYWCYLTESTVIILDQVEIMLSRFRTPNLCVLLLCGVGWECWQSSLGVHVTRRYMPRRAKGAILASVSMRPDVTFPFTSKKSAGSWILISYDRFSDGWRSTANDQLLTALWHQNGNKCSAFQCRRVYLDWLYWSGESILFLDLRFYLLIGLLYW